MSPDDLLFNHFSAGVCLSGPHGSACDGEHSQLVSVSKTNYVFSSFKSAECGGGRWCVSRYLSAGLPTASYRDPTTLPRTCWPSPSVTCCSTLPFISSWRFVCLVTLRMWEAPGESSRHVWDLWSSQFSVCAQLRSGERIKCLALVCILFTAVVWGFALYFFFQGLSTWQVSHTHTHTNLWDLGSCEKTLGLLVSLLWYRKLQLSLVSTTGTASCYHSLTTTTFGISCPPSLCLDPSWYYESCLSLFKHAGYAVGLEWGVKTLISNITSAPPQVLLTMDDDLDTVQRDKIYVF